MDSVCECGGWAFMLAIAASDTITAVLHSMYCAEYEVSLLPAVNICCCVTEDKIKWF